EKIEFERRRDPSFTNKALIVWCDGVLASDRTLADVLVERGAVLRRYASDGWRLLGVGWQPDIAAKQVEPADVQQAYAKLQERLGVEMDILSRPHAGGPPACWCRKPLPGLGVVFIERYRLDPAQCLYVAAGPQDPGFARRLGFQYRDASAFFGSP